MPGYADLINKQMQQIGQPNVTTIERNVPFQWESILPILFMLLMGGDKSKTTESVGVSPIPRGRTPTPFPGGQTPLGGLDKGGAGAQQSMSQLMQLLMSLLKGTGGIGGGIGRP